MKCDEVRPECGPCRKGQRPCAYEPASQSRAADKQDAQEAQNVQHVPDMPFQQVVMEHVSDGGSSSSSNNNNDIIDNIIIPSPSVIRDTNIQADSPLSYRTTGISPGSTEISTGHAPYSWFELLAGDVANLDQNFLLSPLGEARVPATLQPSIEQGSPSNPLLIPRNLREKQSFQAAAFRDIPVTSSSLPPPVEQPAVFRDDRSRWTLQEQIQLNSIEGAMFTHFIHHISTWLDFFDPLKHFGNLIPHLALYNVGLMKALLALSARHISLWEERTRSELGTVNYGTEEINTISRDTSVQYYYETLQHLHKAMHYKSYTRSQELLATAILISTYEMIDGSNQDWERHLKGVFWIQRSQDNDGESGGLRQAVWWTWLQQDMWVALIERRRLFSFWRAKRPLATLDSPELACRSIYLLSQCINYASNEEREGNTIDQRFQRGNELLQMLEDWKQHLPPQFNALPITDIQDMVFPPIWIHPPSHAAAVQSHYLSQILVLTHRPLSGGPLDYSIVQRSIRKAVEIVCGIARTIDKGSTQANYISVMALFVAGTTLHENRERVIAIELIDSCERQIAWSNRSLRTELESEWRQIDLGEIGRHFSINVNS